MDPDPRWPERPPSVDETESIEFDLLLEAVWRRYGWDFRGYAPAHVRRRVGFMMREERTATLSGLQERVLHDPAAFRRLLASLSVNVTSMFRDPVFFRRLRSDVVPLLRTYPSVRIWHAGCATGEEVWSLAIVLAEEGLLDRCRIWATDVSDDAIERARTGTVPAGRLQEWSEAYAASGGQRRLLDHFSSSESGPVVSARLRRRVAFARHNLATDGSFNDFHLVVCRNVLIYFGRQLQERTHRLLYDSLQRLGVLALGARESIRFTPLESRYAPFHEDARLYRKVA